MPTELKDKAKNFTLEAFNRIRSAAAAAKGELAPQQAEAAPQSQQQATPDPNANLNRGISAFRTRLKDMGMDLDQSGELSESARNDLYKQVSDQIGLQWHDQGDGKGYLFKPEEFDGQGEPEKLGKGKFKNLVRSYESQTARAQREARAQQFPFVSQMVETGQVNPDNPEEMQAAWQSAANIAKQNPGGPSAEQLASYGLMYNPSDPNMFTPVSGSYEQPGNAAEVQIAMQALGQIEAQEDALMSGNEELIAKYEKPFGNFFMNSNREVIPYDSEVTMFGDANSPKGQSPLVDYARGEDVGLGRGALGGALRAGSGDFGSTIRGIGRGFKEVATTGLGMEDPMERAQLLFTQANENLYNGNLKAYEQQLTDAKTWLDKGVNDGFEEPPGLSKSLEQSQKQLPGIKSDFRAKSVAHKFRQAHPDYELPAGYKYPPQPPEDQFPKENQRWKEAKESGVPYIWHGQSGEVPAPIKENWTSFTGTKVGPDGEIEYLGERSPKHQERLDRVEARKAQEYADSGQKALDEHQSLVVDPALSKFVELRSISDPEEHRKALDEVLRLQEERPNSKYELTRLADEQAIHDWEKSQDNYAGAEVPESVQVAMQRTQERDSNEKSLRAMWPRVDKMFDEEKKERQMVEDELAISMIQNGQGISEQDIESRVTRAGQDYQIKARDLRIRANKAAAVGDYDVAGELMSRKKLMMNSVTEKARNGQISSPDDVMDLVNTMSDDQQWGAIREEFLNDPDNQSIADSYEDDFDHQKNDFMAFHSKDPSIKEKGRQGITKRIEKEAKPPEPAKPPGQNDPSDPNDPNEPIAQPDPSNPPEVANPPGAVDPSGGTVIDTSPSQRERGIYSDGNKMVWSNEQNKYVAESQDQSNSDIQERQSPGIYSEDGSKMTWDEEQGKYVAEQQQQQVQPVADVVEPEQGPQTPNPGLPSQDMSSGTEQRFEDGSAYSANQEATPNPGLPSQDMKAGEEPRFEEDAQAAEPADAIVDASGRRVPMMLPIDPDSGRRYMTVPSAPGTMTSGDRIYPDEQSAGGESGPSGAPGAAAPAGGNSLMPERLRPKGSPTDVAPQTPVGPGSSPSGPPTPGQPPKSLMPQKDNGGAAGPADDNNLNPVSAAKPNAPAAPPVGGQNGSLAPSAEASAGIKKPDAPQLGVNKKPSRIGNPLGLSGVGNKSVNEAGQSGKELAKFTMGHQTNNLDTKLFPKKAGWLSEHVNGVTSDNIKQAGWLSDHVKMVTDKYVAPAAGVVYSMTAKPFVDAGKGFSNASKNLSAGNTGQGMGHLGGALANTALGASWFLGGGAAGAAAKGGAKLGAKGLAKRFGVKTLNATKSVGRVGGAQIPLFGATKTLGPDNMRHMNTANIRHDSSGGLYNTSNLSKLPGTEPKKRKLPPLRKPSSGKTPFG